MRNFRSLRTALLHRVASFARRLHSSASASGGAVTAEFALVIPVMLLLVFGVVDFGRMMWYRNALQSSVEQAARCYALNRPSCTSAANAQAFAATITVGAHFPSSVFTASSPACGKKVVASYTFTSIVPMIPVNLPITASACRASPT